MNGHLKFRVAYKKEGKGGCDIKGNIVTNTDHLLRLEGEERGETGKDFSIKISSSGHTEDMKL